MTTKYTERAIQTLSNQFHATLVPISKFEEAMLNAIEALERLDVIKKALFYGKDPDFQLRRNMAFRNCNGIDNWFETDSIGQVTIHGIIGAATESGEMLEALYKTIFNGKKFDVVNLKEEIGDSQWYHAILAVMYGFTFEEVQTTNIAKLRKRYPDKFTSFDAINRNIDAERDLLELNPAKDLKNFCDLFKSHSESWLDGLAAKRKEAHDNQQVENFDYYTFEYEFLTEMQKAVEVALSKLPK